MVKSLKIAEDKKILFLLMLVLIFSISFISFVSAEDIRYEILEKLGHGHVLYISEVGTNPYPIPAGSSAVLSFNIKNMGDSKVKDIRLTLSLPKQFTTLNDITIKKLAELNAGESRKIEFDIMALPDVDEGVYETSIYSEYVNPVGTDINENVSIGLALSGDPSIFIKIKNSEIHATNKMGEITLEFVNNDISNIKFLTVELEESEDYEILSPNKEYIGDLDSDDVEGADFRLKITTNKKEIELPLSLTYRDSLNREYNQKLNVMLPIRSAGELGIKQDYTLVIFIVIAIAIVVAFILYKKWKRKKNAKRLH